MDIGGFKHRIKIIKQSNIIDDMGFETEVNEDYMTLFSYINNLKGKEFWEAKQVGFENTLEMIVRYTRKLENINTKTFYIKYNNRLFDIIHIDNIRYENQYIKFKVIERG